MTFSGALTQFRTGPLYFFDQPTKRTRIKGTRCHILRFDVANEGAQLEDTTQSIREDDGEEGKSDELTQRLSDVKPDTPSAVTHKKDQDPLDAYKRAAPRLLYELACLLSRHEWTEKGCIPHGIVNILNYSWHDLTAGVVVPRGESQRGSQKLDEARSGQVSANDKRESAERDSCDARNDGPSVRKPQVSSNPRVKKRKQNDNKDQSSTAVSFSILSSSRKHPGQTCLTVSHCFTVAALLSQLDVICFPGWIIQPKQPSCDEPGWIRLCQWVVERLQLARNPEKLQTADQDINKPLILRHYGDAKTRLNSRRAMRKAQSASLVNGMPQIPDVKQKGPAGQKLHYKINDGSSFIYYPSGCMAVSQSHSALPCGGFYTNVFSDSERPVILATITAFGHGAVTTHPLSSAITAVWDQDGGFIYDDCGNITKEWSWQKGRTPREKIVIQLSDFISVRLLNGTSSVLSFRCNNENVQLPLSALSNINQSRETVRLRWTRR